MHISPPNVYMPDYLVYWKGFWEDTGGDLDEVNHRWYSKNDALHKNIRPGDILWVVVAAGADAPGEWRILQRIRVHGTDLVFDSSRYGPYRIIADEQRSQLFDINQQTDFAGLLRQIDFSSGKRVDAVGALIGRSIQSARAISPSSSPMMDRETKKLKLWRRRSPK